jgi:hypothetical protein
MIGLIREFLSPQQRRIVGEEAKQALQNKHWAEAFAAMDEYLTANELSCDPDNKDKAARIVISRQLLAGIKRELVRKVEDGEMAQIELAEMERRRPMLRRIER